jgi:2-(1,2-epoxy-1,2-dihydrophenyl)acetyl-CoA isomerase
MSDDLELSIQGEIALLQLRRPARGNAMRGQLFDELRKVGLRLADTPPRFVVLHGEGEDFCTGIDPDQTDGLYDLVRTATAARDAYRMQEIVNRMKAPIEAIGRIPCPVVAAIEGKCHGAGLALAFAADLRVAGAGATFSYAEPQVGILTGLGILTRLTLLLGAPRATEFALTAFRMDAAEAEVAGLVNRVCPSGSALATALDLVHEMRRSTTTARQQALLAIRAVQQALVQGAGEHEIQAAARTWIASEWVAARAPDPAGSPSGRPGA